MNDEPGGPGSERVRFGELGTALRQAVAQMRADDVTARRTADEHTASRLAQFDRRLEEISARLPPPSSFRPERAATVACSLARLRLSWSSRLPWSWRLPERSAELVGDRAYANGRAVGYAQAAAFEHDHPAQWRAYQRSTVSLRGR